MTRTGPFLPRDPGLQPERTGLAWSRTAFVMMINVLLFLRGGLTGGGCLLLWSAGVLLLTAAVMWIWGHQRRWLPAAYHFTPLNRLIMLWVTSALVSVAALSILSLLVEE